MIIAPEMTRLGESELRFLYQNVGNMPSIIFDKEQLEKQDCKNHPQSASTSTSDSDSQPSL
jgi:hypothetical protein